MHIYEQICVRKFDLLDVEHLTIDNFFSCYYQQMSQFLQDIDQWISNQQKLSLMTQSRQKLQNIDKNSYVKFDQCLMRHLLPHKQFTNIVTQQGCNLKKYGIMFQNILLGLNGLLSFVYQKLQNKLSIYFHIFNSDDKVFQFQTSQMLIQFVRYLNFLENFNLLPLKLLTNPQRRQITFQIIYFSFNGSNLLQDLQSYHFYKKSNIVLQVFKFFVTKSIPTIQNALKKTLPLQIKSQIEEESKLVENIYRYLSMMTMKSYFCSGQVVTEETKVKQLQQREESGKNLVLRKIQVSPIINKVYNLYGKVEPKKQKKCLKNRHQFYISGAEQKAIRSQISINTNNIEEDKKNKGITALNHIQIFRPERMRTYPLHSGGFASINTAEVNFWLVQSANADKISDDLDLNTLFKKKLAIKTQNRPNGKNLHQIMILKQMKTGYIPSMPKYFIPVNIPEYDFLTNPLIMMDLLIDGSLAEFLTRRKKSLSFYGKLTIMLSITMGLKFLQRFQIVHLDLKPSNIMMAPQLMTKLIDFGQSFHENVVKKMENIYKPGHTLPYSAPELLVGKKNYFTSKSDVYSLGIIFFEIIYGYCPIQSNQKLFLSSQKCDSYGAGQFIRMMNWMISRCLSNNPEERPQLDWIAIIIRLCMDLVV